MINKSTSPDLVSQYDADQCDEIAQKTKTSKLEVDPPEHRKERRNLKREEREGRKRERELEREREITLRCELLLPAVHT